MRKLTACVSLVFAISLTCVAAHGQGNQTIGFWGYPIGHMDSLYAPVGVDLGSGGKDHSLYGGPITTNNSYLHVEAVRLQRQKPLKPWFFIAAIDVLASPPSSNGFVPMVNSQSALVLSMQSETFPNNPSYLKGLCYRRITRAETEDIKRTYAKALKDDPNPEEKLVSTQAGESVLSFKSFPSLPAKSENHDVEDGTWTELRLQTADLRWHHKEVDYEGDPVKGAITIIVYRGGVPIGIDNIQVHE